MRCLRPVSRAARTAAVLGSFTVAALAAAGDIGWPAPQSTVTAGDIGWPAPRPAAPATASADDIGWP